MVLPNAFTIEHLFPKDVSVSILELSNWSDCHQTYSEDLQDIAIGFISTESVCSTVKAQH